MKPRCDGCTSYELASDGFGHCHFLPPPQFRDVRNAVWTPFPIVNPDWWCAQHEAQPVAATPMPKDDFELAAAVAAPEDDF